MSVMKKVGAVALGTGAAAGWLATNAIKAALETAAKNVGDGGRVGSDGKIYTRKDYKGAADKYKSDIWGKGFKAAVKLWKEKD